MKPIGFYYWRGLVLPLLANRKTGEQAVRVPKEFVWLWRKDLDNNKVRVPS
jgi:hypothetical protein